MKLVWTEPAVADLEAIHDYISRDSGTRASRFVERMIVAAERLEQFPKLGRVVPEENREFIRELILNEYRLIYRIAGERIEVLAVIHGRREITRMSRKPWQTE